MKHDLVSPWLPEKRIGKLFSPQAMENFHALFDFQHPQMPQGAKRKVVKPLRGITAAEAAAKYPKGLPIARKGLIEEGEQPYIRGMIGGYSSPWWRGADEDGLWLDLTSTQVMTEVHQRALLNAHLLKPAVFDDNGNYLDADTWVEPTWANFKNRYLRQRFEALDWAVGKVEALIKGKTFKVDVRFEGDAGVRAFEPQKHSYQTDKNGPAGIWHLIEPALIQPLPRS